MNSTSTLCVVVLTCVSIPCFAFQSGSRGSSSGGGFSGQSIAPSPAAASPIQQNFSAPPLQSAQPFATQPGFAPGPATQSNFGFSPNQFQDPGTSFSGAPQQFSSSPQQFGSSPQQLPSPMPQQGGAMGNRGSGSVGVPESSLVDPIFQQSNQNSSYVVDHSTWDGFLSKYLVTDSRGINRIRYGRVSDNDRYSLQSYLEYLQAIDLRQLNRNEQLAYWFNLYNARTVALVVERYPLRSIRQIKQKFTDFVGPFDDEGAVNVLGKSLSLNDIESGIIRPVWNDPRIHYALNCASYGCPNIAPTAWTGYDLDARLNGAAYDYINSNRAVKRGIFGTRVSKIYKWYEADFGGSDQGVLNHIGQFATGNTANKINGRRRIAGYFYDWSLNDGRYLRPRFLESLRR